MNLDHSTAVDVRLSFIGKCCLIVSYVSRLLPSDMSLVGYGEGVCSTAEKCINN